jgi:hypothetical protein
MALSDLAVPYPTQEGRSDRPGGGAVRIKCSAIWIIKRWSFKAALMVIELFSRLLSDLRHPDLLYILAPG